MSLLKRLLGKGDAPDAAAREPVLVNAYATLRDLPPLDMPHRVLGARDLSDPELAEHLRGFVGYVMGRGDGQMTAARYYVWRHLQRVRHHVSFEVDEADLGRIEPWALAANALLFLPDGSVRAPDGAVVIDAAGEGDPVATMPYPDDAVARRVRTRAALADAVLQPPVGMVPALGEGELVLRAPGEVLTRALALLYVAALAHARATRLPAIPAGQEEHNPVGAAALTLQERAFVADEGADANAAAALTWRYEAMSTGSGRRSRRWHGDQAGRTCACVRRARSSTRSTVCGSNTGSFDRRARRRWSLAASTATWWWSGTSHSTG